MHGGNRRNVLLVVVDDLRPQIKAYGVEWMNTPNIDRLAAQGMLFDHAYVQQSICAPTRNSFLSGRYPDKTKAWNFINDFRTGNSEGQKWIALPEFFRLHGYFTTGAGKVYHPHLPANFDQNRSWSEEWSRHSFNKCACGGSGWPPGGQASCEGLLNATCQDDQIASFVVGRLEKAANGTLRSDHSTGPFFIAAGYDSNVCMLLWYSLSS